MIDISGITLDLDDTLWPVAPVIEAAEQRLFQWLGENCPETVRHHTLESMRDLRREIAANDHAVAHDLTEVRRRSLVQVIMRDGAYPESFVDEAMEVFLHHRNRVDLYPDVLPFLKRASAVFPLLSITNGNANPARIGLGQLFTRHVSAIEVGVAKPDARMFLAACDHLNLEPGNILHIGDHPTQDILGASRVGMKTVWVNRSGVDWSHDHHADHEIASLDELVDILTLQQPGDPE